MDPPAILLLGDARLRQPAQRVGRFVDERVRREARILVEALDEFRSRHGFGRAISAPQIAIPRRMIAMRMDGWPEVVLDPEIVWRGPARVTLWDDCMSFPFLLVRVERDAAIRVRYTDLEGRSHQSEELDVATSELLQHEIDHLDGILAVDRAVDGAALVAREEFERDPDFYRSQVGWNPPARVPNKS
jgi:peptide deformylase